MLNVLLSIDSEVCCKQLISDELGFKLLTNCFFPVDVDDLYRLTLLRGCFLIVPVIRLMVDGGSIFPADIEFPGVIKTLGDFGFPGVFNFPGVFKVSLRDVGSI